MNEETPATIELAGKGAPFRTFRHTGPVRSLEQAAAERSQQPDQVVRSIVFRLNEDEYVMVLMAGPKQISWKALRKYLGQSRMTMATDEQVLAATGYVTGTVSPFGLPAPLRIIVDESVLEQDEISLGSGVRGLAILMKSADLIEALGHPETAQLGDAPS